MNNNGTTVHVGFCRDTFSPGTHICLIFRDESEPRKIVSKFVESGILDKEKVGYFADTASPSEVTEWLTTLEVDDSDALDNNSF